MSHHVYLCWSGTRPLYVGCTNDVARRMKEHRSIGGWPTVCDRITTIEFSSRAEALRAETHYISKLRPPHNIRDNPAYVTIAEAKARQAWGEECEAMNGNASTRAAWLAEHPEASAATRKWIATQDRIEARAAARRRQGRAA